MVEKHRPSEPADTPTPPAEQPRRAPGHRGADMRDTVAELAERAQLISQEAGSKVAAAMKDVIGAAAGITGFAIESARDLVQFMVRRGQMTPEEGDKLIREAEAAHDKRPASEKAKPTATKIAAERAAAAKAEAAARAAQAVAAYRAAPPRPIASPSSPSPNGAKANAKMPPHAANTAKAAAAAPAPKSAEKKVTAKAVKASKPAATKAAKPAKAAKKSKKR
jgi:polyhydroxyalkanoate synthesis regulator phasin